MIKTPYDFLRKYIKLPRPIEIWRDVPNKWTPKLIYFYGNMALGESLGQIHKPISVFNTIVGILILFKLEGIASSEIIISIGVLIFFFLLIAGHALLASGFIKQQAELSMYQVPDIIEIRDNLRNLVNN